MDITYVKFRQLPRPKMASPPTTSPSLKFRLREYDEPNEIPDEGTQCDHNHYGEGVIQAGHIYFHPESRAPPSPPSEDVEAFVRENPQLPVVVEGQRIVQTAATVGGQPVKTEKEQVVEVPHLVLARMDLKDEPDGTHPRFAIDKDGCPVIKLFTFGVDTFGKCFPHATHFKDGTQYEGVDIFDWGRVNFDKEHGNSASEAWQSIYKELYAHHKLLVSWF